MTAPLRSKIDQMVEKLVLLSRQNATDPENSLELSEAPRPDQMWMPEELLSIYGTTAYGILSDEQRLKLSQLEFCNLCSISCYGEKEVIASIARLMLKRQFREVRPYLYHLIREENNHISMFAEFCSRYGEMYPSLYSYVQGDLWDNAAIDDLMTFAHVLIFEELVEGMNLRMANDPMLPPLVRRINALHAAEEARHIAFGRELVADLALRVLSQSDPETRRAIQAHVQRFMGTLHHDFHNARIYRAAGIRDAFDLRTSLIAQRDHRFFAQGIGLRERVTSLVRFLTSCGLVSEQSGDPEMAAAAGGSF
jgi:hypothetical protein